MEQLHETLKTIKQSFRLWMNGEASRSMREKGLLYNLNWGIPLMRLKAMAADYPKDLQLAAALWQENVRECRILALLLCPAEEMSLQEAVEWGGRLNNQELAEIAATSLFQYIAEAPALAFLWMETDSSMLQLCAFNVLGRLFRRNWQATAEQQQSFLSAAAKSLGSDDMGLRRAAYNSVMCFADQSEENELDADENLKRQNIEIF